MAHENIVDMSLDDYIASFKKQKSLRTTSDIKNESKFKAERRRNLDEDDIDTNMDDESAAESTGIWRGPDCNTTYLDLDIAQDDELDAILKDESNVSPSKGQPHPRKQINNRQPRNSANFDLREKISGMPNSHSQQWRLMLPNVMNQRPAGMPPLIPQTTFESSQIRQRGNRGNRNQNWNGRRWGNNNRNGFINNNGNPNGNCYLNSRRVQRAQLRNNDILNTNIRAILEQMNREKGNLLPHEVRDLTIECPAESIHLSSNTSNRNLMMNRVPSSTVTMNQAFHIPVEKSSEKNEKSIDGLRAALGINDPSSLKTEMMPMLATKFLDFLQNGAQQTTHKPIYDIKIQKQIHEIQKKPLMYKCPGGEIVSSDGAGINNCEIIPRTSGISLNHRFA